MKKVLVFIFLSLIIGHWSLVWAQEEGDGEVEGVATASAVKIDYPLPYPGILPDSPLWPIKLLRDKIVGWVIFDPVAKSYYELKLADKRLAAGMALLDYGKKDLGIKTMVEAEEHLQRAFEKGDKLKLATAIAKHREVLQERKVESDIPSNLYDRVRKLFEEKLQRIKP